MARAISIGNQDFGEIIENHCFYVDKTSFIKEWWERKDKVTLITRPRRFGKTLTMDMVNRFFSVTHKENRNLFDGLSIWEDESYRNLQGTYPVIFLSFANVKQTNYESARKYICDLITKLYQENRFLVESGFLKGIDVTFFHDVAPNMDDVDASKSLNQLSQYLCQYYGKKVIILLDEYDTPMQEAYVNGYWDELVKFTRSLFNATFKTNPYLEKAIMTGVTRVSKESIFSDLNNLEVITTTSEKYETIFGFTEGEVFEALEEFDLQDQKQKVKYWYDGFHFGNCENIYNPWSIINFLDKKKFASYWTNTSANALISSLVKNGNNRVKRAIEGLLQGEIYKTYLDEEVVFNRINRSKGAIWSFLIASGYLKVVNTEIDEKEETVYELAITNFEVMKMFKHMIVDWFYEDNCDIDKFCDALLDGDVAQMQKSLECDMINILSSFDTTSENSYHMFILGLIACLQHKYVIKSNIETGFGRCDTILYPKDNSQDGIILEYKKIKDNNSSTLQSIAVDALYQIIKKQYFKDFYAHSIPKERIRIYGFAFQGKEVLVDGGYLTEINSRLQAGK